MKKLIIPIIAILVASCSSNQDSSYYFDESEMNEDYIGPFIPSDTTEIIDFDDLIITPKDTIPIDFTKYKKKIGSEKKQIINLNTEVSKEFDLEEDTIPEKIHQIKQFTRQQLSYNHIENNLLQTATEFCNELKITDEDLVEYIGMENANNPQAIKEAKIGLMLFANAVDDCYCEGGDFTLPGDKVEGGSFTDCFLHALGEPCLHLIIEEFASGIITRRMIISVLRYVIKFGGKTIIRNLNGIGLIFTAGEILWCMNN